MLQIAQYLSSFKKKINKNIILTLISIYFFVSAIVLIKESILLLSKEQAQSFFGLVNDTTTGVLVGWFSTALIQSSGALDSITVTLVSAGILKMKAAVGMIIGAELGTTITTQIVSVIGHMSRGKDVFRSSFLVAMLHYFYNLFTLLLFFPIEYLFGTLTHLAISSSSFFNQIPGISIIPSIFSIISPWVDFLLLFLPGWIGFLGGCGLLIFSLRNSEKYMSATFSTDVSKGLIKSTFGKPYLSFLAGFIFTTMVPSTSVMVSLLIPLVATGIITSHKYVLPYILGANIGTVFDVMIAALATGDPVAIGIWIVHLTVNVVGACIFLPVYSPFSTFITKINNFLTYSKKRTLFSVCLLNGLPLLMLLIKSLT